MNTEELLQRWNAGLISNDELRELTARLSEPQHREVLLNAWFLESTLPEILPGSTVAKAQDSGDWKTVESESIAQSKIRGGWLSWRPVTAAAAGILFGMFCSSVVFAYVGPALGKVMTIWQESFESGPAPLVTGMPREIGKWSGDFTEIVGELQGVQPAHGKKMLRFLHADYEGKVSPKGSYLGDMYRLVDLRPYRHNFADGGAIVRLSALFDGAAFAQNKSYQCSVGIYAMDATTALRLRSNHETDIGRDSLALARHGSIQLDRDPATWQPVSVELRLPPATEVLLLHLSMVQSARSDRRTAFEAHFLDDVRLTLGRRAPIP